MLRDKMNIGDSIQCNSIQGKVERITLRETHIRQFTGELTVVPNSMLFKNPVRILNDEPVRRDELVVGISYDADLDQAESILREAVSGVEGVDSSKTILVVAQTFNSSSIDFLIQWWADTTPRDMRITKSDAIKAIKAALDGAEIEIPYPYVTNTFKEALPIDRAHSPEKRAA